MRAMLVLLITLLLPCVLGCERTKGNPSAQPAPATVIPETEMSGEPAQAAVAGDKDSASQPALPSIPKEVTRIDLRCDIVGVGAASRTFYPDGQVQGSHTGGGSVSEQKAKLDAKTLADIWAKAEALVPDYHGVQQKPDPSWHRYFSLILRLRDGTYIVIVWQTEPPGRVKELSDLLFSQEVGYW